MEDDQELLWTEMPNLMFAGSAALSGSARGLVITTGTELGNIASLTQGVEEKPSTLQRAMGVVARIVADVILSSVKEKKGYYE
jgi:magnesium-transporting ATPase (P-type)